MDAKKGSNGRKVITARGSDSHSNAAEKVGSVVAQILLNAEKRGMSTDRTKVIFNDILKTFENVSGEAVAMLLNDLENIIATGALPWPRLNTVPPVYPSVKLEAKCGRALTQ